MLASQSEGCEFKARFRQKFFFINLFLETVSPHEPDKKPFYFIFLLLLHMFTGAKNLLPVHEFHMQFKI